MTETKPAVLVLGGTGFIGRNFVNYLAAKELCSKIYVADKKMASMAYMNDAHKDVFKNKTLVKFYQTDLAKDPHVKKAFAENVDYVFNLCGETRAGMSEADYKEKCITPAKKCGEAAAKMKVKKWVEVSTAHVYKENSKVPNTEESKIDPWTVVASARLQAENALKEIKDLPVVVLRPAVVYGPGDKMGLTPRISCAPVYKKIKETMKFLWDAKLKLNTVHVDDVCAAMWLAATKLKPNSVYNLADKGNSDQGLINGMIGDYFKIKTSFYGWLMSKGAAMMLDTVVDQSNEKHVPTFTEICQEQKIFNTPISPYLDREVLKNKGLCVNGSKIEKEGFVYSVPKLTKELLAAQIKFMQDQKIFPVM